MRQCGNIPNWDWDSCLFTAAYLLEFASSDSRGCYLLKVPYFMFTYVDATRSFSSTWYLKMKHQQTIVHQQSSATVTCNLERATCIPFVASTPRDFVVSSVHTPPGASRAVPPPAPVRKWRVGGNGPLISDEALWTTRRPEPSAAGLLFWEFKDFNG